MLEDHTEFINHMLERHWPAEERAGALPSEVWDSLTFPFPQAEAQGGGRGREQNTLDGPETFAGGSRRSLDPVKFINELD